MRHEQRTATEESPTSGLARFASGIDFGELPDDVKRLAKQCLLDWYGVTVAGAREPLVAMLLQQAAEEGGAEVSAVIGSARRFTPRQAALVNGAASHALDYDDVNIAMIGHPTVAVAPAALALAEAREFTGGDVLAAFVAGYETTCALGELVGPDHYARGFHVTGTVGTFGAAAAGARLLGLDERSTAMALGIAGTQAAGLKSMFGTMCKPLHAGKACESGLLAAMLAARGFDSRLDVIECIQGFAATQSSSFDATRLHARGAGDFHIRRNLFKYHASCYQTHATIEAAKALRITHGFELRQVRKVSVRNDAGADTVCNIAEPRTGLEAKFSLRLAAAMALAGDDTGAIATFDDANVNRPELSALRDKVVVGFAPNWPITRSDIAIELEDGRRLEATFDAGVPGSDLDLQEQRLRAKFDALVVPCLGRARAQELAGLVLNIEHCHDLAELGRLCSP